MVAVVVGRVDVVVQHPLRPNHPEFTGILLLEEPPAARQRLLQPFTGRHDAALGHEVRKEWREGACSKVVLRHLGMVMRQLHLILGHRILVTLVRVDPVVFLDVVVEDDQRAVVDDVHVMLGGQRAIDDPDDLTGGGAELQNALEVAETEEQVVHLKEGRGIQRRLHVVQVQGVLRVAGPQDQVIKPIGLEDLQH